ncbi:hypothetical protein [Sphingomonas soli]|uniref:hypothetical protein n=1 Tax=Sphingomonas soli TaxID=266127 RepID=UPI0008298653|nr:hypothetical protein [Sphingomonas soli]
MTVALDVERLLLTAARRHALADEHEAKAVEIIEAGDPALVERAAAHFTIAASLRGRARFVS